MLIYHIYQKWYLYIWKLNKYLQYRHTSHLLVSWLSIMISISNAARHLFYIFPAQFPDFFNYVQLTKAYFAFLEVLFSSHIIFVLNLDTNTFMHIVGSLESGLKNLDTGISSQVCMLFSCFDVQFLSSFFFSFFLSFLRTNHTWF